MIPPLLVSLLSLVLLTLASLVALWAPLPEAVRPVVILMSAVAAGGLSALAWARQRRQLRRARQLAERVLAAGPGESKQAAELAGLEDRGPEHDELTRLKKTLAQINRQYAGQVRELAKKSRNLSSLLDGLEEPLLVTDNDDLVLLCNRAAEGLTDSPPGTLIGKPLKGLFTSTELTRMHAGARAGQTHRGRCVLSSVLGVRTYQVSAAPLPAAWGEGVFGVVLVLRDVTDLAGAAKMSSDFVANASHELRTPLSAVRMAVETLQGGAKDEPAMRDRLLGMAEGHIARLEMLLRDLMDLSRLDAQGPQLVPSEIDLPDLLAHLREVFTPACAERRLTLVFEPDPALAGFVSDARWLELIVRNLVDNACKYAHEGTAIVVRARRDGTGAHIEVIDHGVGIPLNQQERVFERFYQVDMARTGVTGKRGTGLGLALVKSAAEVLGGRVGLESVWGQGTRVWVDLPSMTRP